MPQFNAEEDTGDVDECRSMEGEGSREGDGDSRVVEEELCDRAGAEREGSEVCTAGPEGFSDTSLQAVSDRATAGTSETSPPPQGNPPPGSGDCAGKSVSPRSVETEPAGTAESENPSQSADLLGESEPQEVSSRANQAGEVPSTSAGEFAEAGVGAGKSLAGIEKVRYKAKGLPHNPVSKYLDARSWHGINASSPPSDGRKGDAAQAPRSPKYRSSEASISDGIWHIVAQSPIGKYVIPRAVSRSVFGGSNTSEVVDGGAAMQADAVEEDPKTDAFSSKGAESPLPSEIPDSLVALESSLDSFRRVSESQGSHVSDADRTGKKTPVVGSEAQSAVWSDNTVTDAHGPYGEDSKQGHEALENVSSRKFSGCGDLIDLDADFASQWFNLLLDDGKGIPVKVRDILIVLSSTSVRSIGCK